MNHTYSEKLWKAVKNSSTLQNIQFATGYFVVSSQNAAYLFDSVFKKKKMHCGLMTQKGTKVAG